VNFTKDIILRFFAEIPKLGCGNSLLPHIAPWPKNYGILKSNLSKN